MDDELTLAIAYVVRTHRLMDIDRAGVAAGLDYVPAEVLAVLARAEESLRKTEAEARDIIYGALAATESS